MTEIKNNMMIDDDRMKQMNIYEHIEDDDVTNKKNWSPKLSAYHLVDTHQHMQMTSIPN